MVPKMTHSLTPGAWPGGGPELFALLYASVEVIGQ